MVGIRSAFLQYVTSLSHSGPGMGDTSRSGSTSPPILKENSAAAKSLQSCPTLCNIEGSPPGFSVHGIFQARVLEWGAIALSKENSSDSNSGHKTNKHRSSFSRKIQLRG